MSHDLLPADRTTRLFSLIPSTLPFALSANCLVVRRERY